MTPPAILLIDGDADSLEIFSMILEHHDFRVLRASADEEGCRLAREARPDLIVCDPFTQWVGGARLFEALRGHPATASIPVLVITSVPRHAAAVASAAGVLSKPCEPGRLVREVERLLPAAARAEMAVPLPA